MPEIKEGPGEGTTVYLDENEVAEAIDAWTERQGIMVKGPRTIFLEEEGSAMIHVDPSGVVESGLKEDLACDCMCCEEGRCVCGDYPCPCDKQLYAIVAITRVKEGESGVPTTIKLARGAAAAAKELRRMVNVVATPGQKLQVEIGDSELWAHVHLECGASYGFYAEKTSWAKERA